MGFVFLRGSLKVQYILHASLSGRNSSNSADRDQLPKFFLQCFPAERSQTRKQYKFNAGKRHLVMKPEGRLLFAPSSKL